MGSASRVSILRRDGGSFALDQVACLRITGTDRLRYLNGQVSNDLRRIPSASALPALVLTAKGKLCAKVWIWEEGEALMVEVPAVLGEIMLARLERYAISDDVTFERLTELPPRWHVFGAAAEALDGIHLARLGKAGVDLSVAPSGILEASAGEVEVLRIERGVPCWGRELTEETLPQEAGLEREAVDFKKGCYVGQEVVSRIQSVGRVNRQLAGFIGDFEPSRAAGLRTEAGEKAGTVTSALLHPETGHAIALGFLSTRQFGETFVVVDETGACLGRAERSQFPLVS